MQSKISITLDIKEYQKQLRKVVRAAKKFEAELEILKVTKFTTGTKKVK